MNFCIYCGFPLKPEDQTCPRCGSQIAQENPNASVEEPEVNAVRPEQSTQPSQQEPSVAQPQNPAYEAPKAPQYMPAGNVGGSYPPPYGQNGYAPYMPQFQPPESLSLGTIVGMLVLGNIPLVGWIVMLIWAFDHTPRPNRRNLARGILILKLIGIAVVIVFWILLALWGYGLTRFYYSY